MRRLGVFQWGCVMTKSKVKTHKFLDDMLLNQDHELPNALDQQPTAFNELVSDQDEEFLDSIIMMVGDTIGLLGIDDE